MLRKNKKQNYNLTAEEIFKKYKSGKDGISEEEAAKRLDQFGLNELKRKREWKWVKIVLAQFNDALVWILLVAGALALIFAENRDATIIFIIILLNAVIGFFQRSVPAAQVPKQKTGKHPSRDPPPISG